MVRSGGLRAPLVKEEARRPADDALRREADEARRGEQFALRVIDKLFAFVGVLAADGTLLHVNEAPLAVAGIGIDDVRGKKFWDCFWWSYSDEVKGRLRAACERAARGEVVRYDAVVRTAGDTRMTIDFQIAPLHDDAGNVTHLIPSAVDITERKRTEIDLRRSEELVRTIAENSTQGFAMMDERGYCTYANRAWLEMTGYSHDEIGSAPLHDLVHHHHADGRPYPMSECPIDRALPENFEIRAHEDLFFRKDGGAFPVLCAASPIFKDGRPISTVIEIRDMTAAKLAEAARRKSEARFRTISEALPSLVFVHSSEGENSFVNRGFCDFAGRGPEGLLGSAWRDLLHPEDAEAHWPRWRAAVAEGRPFEAEYRMRRRDGAWRWHLVRTVPHRDADGSITQWIGTATDITERREVEEALREADRRKDQFIAVLAHELRNPLAPVRNAVHILQKVEPVDPRIERARQVIDRQVTHMVRLIDDLLDVSRIARGKLTLQRETCDLGEIARQTAEDYRSSLEAAGLQLAVVPAREPLRVEGDSVRLAQMVGNLLHNAMRFTDRGGRVEVRAELDAANRLAMVHVSDTGVGIAPALLSRLFDTFSQADQDLARSKGGLGLGLALTKGLAALHGGTVTAHSDGPGRGALFTICIPIGAERRGRPSPDSAAGRACGGLRVLVVEDNHDAAETLGELLELAGHEVALAFDGATAVTAARAQRPDVVISDIGLPGELDGYAVARALRADPALGGVHLIALSGYADEDARRRSREAGFDEHLAKPPDIAALERALARLRG
jgi:PAS domain S-box-containing protein